jgi:hypothetical protein
VRGLIIPLIIHTIRQDPPGPVWIDEASNVSRLDPSGADQIDAEYQPMDLVRSASWSYYSPPIGRARAFASYRTGAASRPVVCGCWPTTSAWSAGSAGGQP